MKIPFLLAATFPSLHAKLSFLLAIPLLLGATAVRADLINLVSANRFVSVSGQAGNSNGSNSYSDSQTAILFNPFNGSVSGSAIWPSPDYPPYFSRADSSAAQNSSLGAFQFSLSQQIGVSFITPFPGGGFAQAIAQTSFQVTFTVPEAVNFLLTSSGGGSGNMEGIIYSQTFSLTGMNVVLGGTYSGLLLPGQTYVLTLSQQLTGGPADPIGEAGIAQGDVEMQFSSVPEPDAFSCLLLGGLAIAVFQWAARKRGTPSGQIALRRDALLRARVHRRR